MVNKSVDYIKSLGIDMINEAGSGHPGIVLGSAPIMYTLFSKHLNVNPDNPNWSNRDRFVMSAGHGSALLYATLHLAGYDIKIDDLKKFRSLGSITPGHPEFRVTPGVDMTTGPLGQGISSAVGMAIAEAHLRNTYKFESKHLFDYYTYVLCGDGDLMEGVSYEAISLAGHLSLNKLIVMYDSNNITLDGKLDYSFNENIKERFSSCGWEYINVTDGEDIEAIDNAITLAKKNSKPTLIEVKTVIGRGSLIENTNEVHGKALTEKDIKQLKGKLGIFDEPFKVPSSVYFKKNILDRVKPLIKDWDKNIKDYITEFPNDKGAIEGLVTHKVKLDVNSLEFDTEYEVEATRILNGKVMNVIADNMPLLIGGSADLSSSTKAILKNTEMFSSDNNKAKNIFYGVREHAMASISNGISLSGLRPFASTFLVFSDYMKPSIRLSSLMKLPVTYIFTHDAINIGSDGPTHEPIEQLVSLRSIPNMTVYRPADLNEIIGSWNEIINNNRPASLILSRKETPLIKGSSKENVKMGAYIVSDASKLDGIIIATGSEVSLAIDVSELLKENNLNFRVVSMPSMELFNKQTKKYKQEVIPNGYPVFAIEEGSSYSWYKYVTSEEYLFTIDTFGESGSSSEVEKHFGFDPDIIKDKILKTLKK